MIRVTSLPLAPFSRCEWRTWLRVMLASVGLEAEKGADSPEISVELVLMRDGDIAALNFAYLGCPGPTNILSFPAESEQSATEGGVERGAVRDNPASTGMAGGVADKSPSSKKPSGAGQDRTARNLGSLFLSVDTLRRERLLYEQDEAEHARRLLAHGLAHLLGHDHGPAMDAVCETMLAERFA